MTTKRRKPKQRGRSQCCATPSFAPPCTVCKHEEPISVTKQENRQDETRNAQSSFKLHRPVRNMDEKEVENVALLDATNV